MRQSRAGSGAAEPRRSPGWRQRTGAVHPGQCPSRLRRPRSRPERLSTRARDQPGLRASDHQSRAPGDRKRRPHRGAPCIAPRADRRPGLRRAAIAAGRGAPGGRRVHIRLATLFHANERSEPGPQAGRIAVLERRTIGRRRVAASGRWRDRRRAHACAVSQAIRGTGGSGHAKSPGAVDGPPSNRLPVDHGDGPFRAGSRRWRLATAFDAGHAPGGDTGRGRSPV